MAEKVAFAITGIKEIDDKLRDLPAKVIKKLAKSGLREAMRPLLATAKRNAPRRTGALRKNIKLRVMTRLRNKKSAVGMRVSGGEDFKGETYYGGFQEFGWQPKGEGPKVPPKHYMTNAYNHHKGEVVAKFREVMKDAIEESAGEK